MKYLTGITLDGKALMIQLTEQDGTLLALEHAGTSLRVDCSVGSYVFLRETVGFETNPNDAVRGLLLKAHPELLGRRAPVTPTDVERLLETREEADHGDED